MESVKSTYIGELRTRSVHIASGQEVVAFGDPECSGEGGNFSPTDLLCASLVSCMLTVMAQAAKDRGFSIEGTEAKMSKVMAMGPDRLGEITIDFIFPGGSYNEKQKRTLERAAMMGPVALSLHPQIMLVVSFYYPENA